MRRLDAGIGIISIDTERMWAYADLYREAKFRERFPLAIEVHDWLLEALCDSRISATWAIVGGLALPGSTGRSDLCLTGLPKTWIRRIPAGDEQSRPLWYARQWVRRVRDAAVVQEIGLHGGMAHIIWNSPEMTAGMAWRELNLGVKALRQLQVEPRSFVFPRDLEAHLGVVRDSGIACFRGRAPILSERFGYSLAGAVARAAEELAAVAPPPVWPTETLPGLWNIPASMSLYPMNRRRTRLVPLSLRVRRSVLGLDAAIRARGIFHLAMHPENLAEVPEARRVFQDILGEMTRRRERGDLRIMSMAEALEFWTESTCEAVESTRPNRAATARERLLRTSVRS